MNGEYGEYGGHERYGNSTVFVIKVGQLLETYCLFCALPRPCVDVAGRETIISAASLRCIPITLLSIIPFVA